MYKKVVKLITNAIITLMIIVVGAVLMFYTHVGFKYAHNKINISIEIAEPIDNK